MIESSKELIRDFYNKAINLSGHEPDPFDVDDKNSRYYGKLVCLYGDYFIFKAHPDYRYVGFCGIHKVYTGIWGESKWEMCGCEEHGWAYGRYSLDSVFPAEINMEFFQEVLKNCGYRWDGENLKLVKL
jgi:hypothetical protein